MNKITVFKFLSTFHPFVLDCPSEVFQDFTASSCDHGTMGQVFNQYLTPLEFQKIVTMTFPVDSFLQRSLFGRIYVHSHGWDMFCPWLNNQYCYSMK